MARGGLVWLLIVGCLVTTGLSGNALERLSEQRSSSNQLLYLPNGQYLKLASLGQAPVLADLIYVWAIQFYSNYDRADRFLYVEHVFGDVITELDPHFTDAYWLGALILIVEAKDLDGGLALIDRGIAKNPEQWILPYLAGWECWLARRPARAAEYFDRAVSVADAPPAVRRMHAAMISRAGQLDTALSLWQEIRDDPLSDPSSVAIAERKLREVRVQIDLRDLGVAIEEFRSRNTGYPRTLEELEQEGYIRFVPRDPDGRAYDYDPRSGKVSAAGASSENPREPVSRAAAQHHRVPVRGGLREFC